ncbi:MAG: GTPase HflX [Armatimonadota bacterium]|nr:GTPase HflX [Armatimonadota bacterium]
MRLPFLLGIPRRLPRPIRQELVLLRTFVVREDLACPPELAQRLASLAYRMQREVGVLVSRHGTVVYGLVGRSWPGLEERLLARRRGALCGLRLVLAYNQALSEPTESDLALLERTRLDLLVTVGHRKGIPTEAWVSFLDHRGPCVEGPFAPEELETVRSTERIRSAEAALRRLPTDRQEERRMERAILVGVQVPGRDGWSTDETMEELRRLAETAGAEVVDVVVQTRSRPDPGTLIGRGKVGELRSLVELEAADLVVFDQELSPAQQRTLEEELGVKVLDRTALVLDIFARRARTREGALQVELAQLSYLLPRLAGKGILLSRLGGGIGTRGPGETKLEMDRRRIRTRIADLQREIAVLSQVRRTQRRARQQAETPVVALVGYTNTGKSTLLNALTQAGVFVEDKLFATLDPTARQVRLPGGGNVILVDTVGFIRKLPPQLIAAFRATLEEVTEADVLVHVLDVSHPDWPTQRQVVERILAELGAGTKPTVLALNKTDRLPAGEVERIAAQTGGVPISALHGVGLVDLLRRIQQALPEPVTRAALEVPYTQAGILHTLYEHGRVLTRRDGPEGIRVEVEAPLFLVRQVQALLRQGVSGGGEEGLPPSPRSPLPWT